MSLSVPPQIVPKHAADPVERFVFSTTVNVSVIIPHFYSSRRENVAQLIDCLRRQTFPHTEVLVVNGVSPQGRAINTGVRAAQGRIFVVLDDDSQMDRTDILEKLVEAVEKNPDVGMAGASIISPENINAFQRTAAKQFPRFHMPVVNQITDSDMPCHGCVAFPRGVFEKVGMERETILRGLDPDLRVRIRKAGYRVVLVPGVWVYHPFPDTIQKFIRLFFRNGYGSSYIQIFHPEINYDTDESLDSKNFVPKRSFTYRILRFPVRLLKSLLAFQWIRFLGYSVYLAGYVYGFIKFNLIKVSGRSAQL